MLNATRQVGATFGVVAMGALATDRAAAGTGAALLLAAVIAAAAAAWFAQVGRSAAGPRSGDTRSAD